MENNSSNINSLNQSSSITTSTKKILIISTLYSLVIGATIGYLFGINTNNISNTTYNAFKINSGPTPTQIINKDNEDCNKTFEWYYSIRLSTLPEYCELEFIGNLDKPDFRIKYPKIWTVDLAGAAGSNLMFNQQTPQEIFMLRMTTNSPLAQAYKDNYVYEDNSNPLIGPDEEIITKSEISLGDKQVLSVITKNKEILTQYYFILNKNPSENSSRLYMFKFNQSDQNLKFEVEKIISQLHFVR